MYNHTGLQGRLTATPELSYTPSGTPSSFSSWSLMESLNYD